jgi:hypothetical protein
MIKVGKDKKMTDVIHFHKMHGAESGCIYMYRVTRPEIRTSGSILTRCGEGHSHEVRLTSDGMMAYKRNILF